MRHYLTILTIFTIFFFFFSLVRVYKNFPIDYTNQHKHLLGIEADTDFNDNLILHYIVYRILYKFERTLLASLNHCFDI